MTLEIQILALDRLKTVVVLFNLILTMFVYLLFVVIILNPCCIKYIYI